MKKLYGFSFSINMANFEAFWGVKKLSANLSFLKCDVTAHFVAEILLPSLTSGADQSTTRLAAPLHQHKASSL